MADQYEGLDEAALNELMNKAESYEERSAIRKALRAFKGSKSKKQVGSASYRRAGWQAPKSMAIPNSVTGNILPSKVNVTENKVETPQNKTTASYLKGDKQTPYGEQGRRRSSGTGPTGVQRGPSPKLTASPRESVSSYTSVTPEPKDLAEPEKAPEVVKAEAFEDEEPREPTPEPPREPTPEPPREPTPEPEPSPEPPREPTPEPPREPTPEPPREPTPEPVREPTPEPTPSPEPPREPTPEPEPSPEPEEEEAPAGYAEEEEVDDEDEEEAANDDEEEEEEEEVGEDGDENEDEDRRSHRSSRKDGPNYRGGRSSYDPSKVGVKTSLPMDVMSKKEEGVDGDFRTKLRKAKETTIDTTKAFPQAQTKGEQVSFKNVLRKTSGPERKTFKTGAAAQSDFRGSLRGRRSPNAAPETKPKSRRNRAAEEPAEQEPEPEYESAPVEPEQDQVEPELEQLQEPEDEVDAQPEPEPEPEPEPVEPEPEPEPVEPEPEKPKEESYESRVAERRRRRAERVKEMEKEEVKKEEKPVQNGTAEVEDSYEARREARKKAREERLKAASAKGDDKPRLSYRERKALEAKENAKGSRNKWANREEESGEKAEAKGSSFVKSQNSATQQLLAWCQHKTKFYENVEVKDFRQSWSNGMAFCAILHSFLPDKIPYDELSPSDPRTNFTVAFEAAKDAGIPEMLDVEDMVSVKIPDAKSIMTFLVTIYQHFN